jgi:CHAT domain-containing protein/tetratricopeptide (TPR) repeat protein
MPATPDVPDSVDALLARLALEPDAQERRRMLDASEADAAGLVQRLYDEVVRLARVDLRSADRLARSAEWLARRAGDEASRALGLRAMGHIHYLNGRSEAAWNNYSAALAIYEKLGRDLEVGRTLSGGSLQILAYLGRYDEAFAWAERAREIFTRHGDRLRLARLDTNMANVLNRLDRFEEALELYRRAYATFVDVGDPQDVAIALRNMATCQIGLNEFHEALDTYNKARAWCVEHQMPLLVGEADYNIAYLYYLRGEYTRALELYARARERCHDLGDQYHQGLCDLDQSEMYLELNLSEESAHMARRALEAFRQLGMGYESAKALTNLAIASSRHGDALAALEQFRKARELFIREKNQAWTAMIDLYQALVVFDGGRLEDARALCESAFAYFSESPLAGKAALCRLLLARIELNSGRPELAKTECRNALERAESAESPALRYQAQFVLGLIEEALGDPEAAYQAYLRAHGLLENLRSQLNAEEMKIAFLKDKLAVYEALVRMCLAKGAPADEEAAFTFIEQAKSRSLADLIAFRATHIPAPRETRRVLVEQVGALREQLHWYARTLQIMEGRPSAGQAQVEKLRRLAHDCERRLAEAFSTLRVEEFEFVQIQAAGSIGLEAIRSSLPAGAALLQYYRVGDVFHACVLSARGLKIVRLGSASGLRRELQLLRFQLSKFRLGAEHARTFQRQLLEASNAHLHEFYKALIAPLEGVLDATHLLVAPHEFLHYLPFQAMFDGAGYLGDRFSISYTPSGSVFYLCRRGAGPLARNSGAPAAGLPADAASAGRSLILGVPDPAAPHILEEAHAVASVLPDPEVLIGPEATADALRRKGPLSRYVHIATHGWFRQDNPMFSSIGLGDSQLNLFDLYQLNLPAELVTLSGCGTGLNVVVGGDELLGLKRGLLYAGAQAVLLTLWDVNDQSTAGFMKLFYTRLKTTRNKAEAMQAAMRELREQYPHPFYWAPFVLVGKYD